MKPKIIIDTDPGTDDAMAVFMVLEGHKRGVVDLVAITTSFGNTSLKCTNKNTLRILETAEQLQIPVYPGSKDPLVKWPLYPPDPHFHGKDGFGEIAFDTCVDLSLLKEEHAALAIIRIIEENKGEITLLSLATPTNLAIVLNLKPNCFNQLRGFYMMGGNTTGEGNISLCGEFNFFSDPESAKVVLERSKCVINLVPWETCILHSFTLEEREEFYSINSPTSNLIRRIEAFIIEKNAFSKRWVTCDQMAAAWMMDDLLRDPASSKKLTTKTVTHYGTVELGSGHVSGQLILDRNKFLQKSDNLQILLDVDRNIYTSYIKMAVGWTEERFPWQ